MVVLDDVDDGEPPDRAQVDGLVEVASIARPVAEGDRGHGVALPIPLGEGRAGGLGDDGAQVAGDVEGDVALQVLLLARTVARRARGLTARRVYPASLTRTLTTPYPAAPPRGRRRAGRDVPPECQRAADGAGPRRTSGHDPTGGGVPCAVEGNSTYNATSPSGLYRFRSLPA